jgi:hypothetical protein
MLVSVFSAVITFSDLEVLEDWVNTKHKTHCRKTE